MGTKQDLVMQSVRAVKCINQIDKLKKSLLGHPYIRGFVHDITYGKGRFSILTNDNAYLKYYYVNQLPAFFTDESGRFLPNGSYFTHTLPLSDDENRLMKTITSTFGFEYIFHIVKHEGDIQHTYSFMLSCDEKQLLFFIANKLPYIQRFITIYERQCYDAIDYVKAEKNHLILPYSPGKEEALSALLQSYLVDEEPRDNTQLHLPHALDNQLVNLTPQQARCFQLILQGSSAKEIAQLLNLSYRTIQHYTACIYEKLGLNNRYELISHYAYLAK